MPARHVGHVKLSGYKMILTGAMLVAKSVSESMSEGRFPSALANDTSSISYVAVHTGLLNDLCGPSQDVCGLKDGSKLV